MCIYIMYYIYEDCVLSPYWQKPVSAESIGCQVSTSKTAETPATQSVKIREGSVKGTVKVETQMFVKCKKHGGREDP